MARLPNILQLLPPGAQAPSSSSGGSSCGSTGVVEPAAQASSVKGRRGSSTPCAHSTDMDTRLQDLRRRLAHTCSSQHQAVDGDSSSSTAHSLGPAVSALFDLLATLCPADLLQMAQQLMLPCPDPATAAAGGGSHSRQAACNCSSSSRAAAAAAAAEQPQQSRFPVRSDPGLRSCWRQGLACCWRVPKG